MGWRIALQLSAKVYLEILSGDKRTPLLGMSQGELAMSQSSWTDARWIATQDGPNSQIEEFLQVGYECER